MAVVLDLANPRPRRHPEKVHRPDSTPLAKPGLAHFVVTSVDRDDAEVGLCAEIMSESRRNPDIARLYQDIEQDVKERVIAMLRHAAERGEIRSDIDLETAATVLMVLGDGMSWRRFWRRAVDANVDAERVTAMILQVVRCLLTKPVDRSGKSGESL